MHIISALGRAEAGGLLQIQSLSTWQSEFKANLNYTVKPLLKKRHPPPPITTHKKTNNKKARGGTFLLEGWGRRIVISSRTWNLNLYSETLSPTNQPTNQKKERLGFILSLSQTQLSLFKSHQLFNYAVLASGNTDTCKRLQSKALKFPEEKTSSKYLVYTPLSTSILGTYHYTSLCQLYKLESEQHTKHN